jgi:hypothetical protein
MLSSGKCRIAAGQVTQTPRRGVAQSPLQLGAALTTCIGWRVRPHRPALHPARPRSHTIHRSALLPCAQEVFTLSAWYHDVLKRYEQLAAWTAGDVVTPHSVWLPGLFNPKAFLTAVMQAYARAHKLPLDVMQVG